MPNIKSATLKIVNMKVAICPNCKEINFLRKDHIVGDTIKCGHSGEESFGHCNQSFVLNKQEEGTFKLPKFFKRNFK